MCMKDFFLLRQNREGYITHLLFSCVPGVDLVFCAWEGKGLIMGKRNR